MSDTKMNIKEELVKGRIYARLIFEIMGTPRENVEKAIRLLVEKLKTLDGVRVVVEKYFDPKKIEEMWSNFVEVELFLDNITTLVNMSVDFLPTSIEIIEPEHMSMPSREFGGVLNDLTVKLLKISNEYQTASVENHLIKKKMNTLISVIVLKSLSNSSKTMKELSNDIRIEEDDVKLFLDDLIKNNKVELKEDKYSLIT